MGWCRGVAVAAVILSIFAPAASAADALLDPIVPSRDGAGPIGDAAGWQLALHAELRRGAGRRVVSLPVAAKDDEPTPVATPSQPIMTVRTADRA